VWQTGNRTVNIEKERFSSYYSQSVVQNSVLAVIFKNSSQKYGLTGMMGHDGLACIVYSFTESNFDCLTNRKTTLWVLF